MIISVLSIIFAFLTFLANYQSNVIAASVAETSSFLSIIKDMENLAEEIKSSEDDDVRIIRMSKYLNFLEAIAFLVNKKHFSRSVRKELSEIIINYIILAGQTGYWNEVIDLSIRKNNLSYQELRKIERRNFKRISELRTDKADDICVSIFRLIDEKA